MGEIDLLSEYVEQARSLLYRLDESLANVKSINEEESHFVWEITQYPLLAEVLPPLNIVSRNLTLIP